MSCARCGNKVLMFDEQGDLSCLICGRVRFAKRRRSKLRRRGGKRRRRVAA